MKTSILRRKTLLFAVLISVLACTSNTIYKKPKDLISKATMIDLLTDIYMAKSAQHVKNKNHQRNVDYVNIVYKKYGIDSARFSRSNIYYMSKIDVYESMHKEVSKRIQIMVDERTDTTKLQEIKPDRTGLRHNKPIKKPSQL